VLELKTELRLKGLKILKIGGAVITDKSPGVFDRAKMDTIERIAKEVATNPSGLILIHGVGSFGHPYVEKYGLKNGRWNVKGVAETHLACEKLCCMVCSALAKEGLNPAPIHPFTSFRIGNRLEFDANFIAELVDDGFVPVLHGDMVRSFDGYAVLSGDRIAAELAKTFGAEKLGFASDTAIVVDGRIVEEVNNDNVSLVLKKLEKETGKSDVTGGMRGKVLSVLEVARQSEVFIFSGLEPGNVAKFLVGEKVGTKIRLWK